MTDSPPTQGGMPEPPPVTSPRPSPPPRQMRRPGLRRLQDLTGRQRLLLLSGVLTLVLALVAGALAATGTKATAGSDPSATAAQQNRKQDLLPFRQAVEDLAAAPGLRYQDTSVVGILERDITVTAGGSRFGTTGSGNERHDLNILRIGGKSFSRWKADPNPDTDVKPGTKVPGKWRVEQYDNSDSLYGEIIRWPSPPKLAAQLSAALGEFDDASQQKATKLRPGAVNGTPALGIETSAGRLLITKREPHRVLRLEPYTPSEMVDRYRQGATEIPRVTRGPLADGGSEGMDLTPVTGSAADTMFDTLVDYTEQLKDATDQGISFSLDSAGDLKCSSSGCTASTSFTGKVYGKAKTRIVGGQVTAVMTAVFTIDGKNAGRCTSKHVALPVKGNRASGKLSCSNPGAGPVYASVAAQYKAQAEAQSRASGGRTIRYTIPNRATTEIDARALAAVEVKQLVGQAKRERNAANCAKPHSFPPGTRVLVSSGLSVPIESVRRGDQVVATDPDTGLTALRTTTDTFTTQADKDFTRLTTATGQVTTTDTHPFWLNDERRWSDAGEINAGDLLREPSGRSLPVLSVARFTQRQTTHDLTVAGLHTYYVLSGRTPVLVHNASCPTFTTKKPISGPLPDAGQTSLYALTKPLSGELLKWGISKNPVSRYRNSDYKGGVQLVILRNYDSRRDALDAERYMTERHPGPLNSEQHRGSVAPNQSWEKDLQYVTGGGFFRDRDGW
ncbi:polymorphic toxin-type HINT domain-containing protein [Streptomyces sp. CFMR 7]|uniref:polymorphic toxin-type HINT domain-containing protein n=1 Tax=Streptomyces sp. CFMR 7 TaxID=1649184 RepID=UPI0011A92668|nr:polymorphic toxin-type HINT domain-containing protein [Streptomyces sp. CFMR 7]